MSVLTRSVTLATLGLLAAYPLANAQNAPATTKITTTRGGEIRGRVVNTAGDAPVGVATVQVTNSGAVAAAARTSTGADGGFRVQGLRPGRYRIRIRAIGFTPRELPAVEIGAASPSVDIGTVTLTAAPLELQAVAVTGRQQEVQLAPDRNTYVVRGLCHIGGRRVAWAAPTTPEPDRGRASEPVPWPPLPARGDRPRGPALPPLRPQLPRRRGTARRTGSRRLVRDRARLGGQVRGAVRRGTPAAGAGRTWHLDEMGVRVGGRLHWLWRAVDEHGQTLDVCRHERRDTAAALQFFRRLLDVTAGTTPARIATDT